MIGPMRSPLLLTTATLALLAGCQATVPGPTAQEQAAAREHPGAPQTIANPVSEPGAGATPTGEPDGRGDFAAGVVPGKDNGLPSQAQAQAEIAAPKRDGRAHQYELRTYGTDIEIYQDGQPVPQERILVKGNHVGVLDANGTVIERMTLPRNWNKLESAPDTSVLAGDPYNFKDVAGNQLVPPKTMLGGRLSNVPQPLLVHLEKEGVQRGRASIVTGVIPDLPLARAGVQDHDVIVGVNDVPDADPNSVRAVVRTLDPGQNIKLRVLRNGKQFDANVQVDKWDAKYMVRPLGDRSDPIANPVKVVQTPSPDGALEAARNQAKSLQSKVKHLEAELATVREELAAMQQAGAAATASAASGAAPTAQTHAALHAEIGRLKHQVEVLQRQLRAAEQVKDAIRPAGAKQPGGEDASTGASGAGGATGAGGANPGATGAGAAPETPASAAPATAPKS
ncbi:MAG: PDZ domain-containing protein [Phycisphaerales bacterium]